MTASPLCVRCRLNIGAARSDLGRVARQLAGDDVPRLRSRLKLAKAHLARQEAYAATCVRCAAIAAAADGGDAA